MTARRILSEADKDSREALSPSTAKILVAESPMHARHSLDNRRTATKQMDVGSAVHAMLLGVGKPIRTVDAPTWQSKKAKEERDGARAAGMVPMLLGDYERFQKAVEAIGPKLAARGVDLSGDAEIKIEWTVADDGVLCRGVPDCVTGLDVIDLKVGEYVPPSAVGRKVYTEGADIQGAAYLEALGELEPSDAGRFTFRLIYIQSEPPYGITIASLGGIFLDLGEMRWKRAKTLWAACQKAGQWPDYSGEVVRAEPPKWALYQEGMA